MPTIDPLDKTVPPTGPSMYNITSVLNEKFGVAGGTIAEAVSQAAGVQNDNIAEAFAALNVAAPEAMTISVATPANMEAMPTTETATNSALATVTADDDTITITLEGLVSDLEDAAHGEPWGTHKWLGFGVDTGFESVEGVTFTDDTGATATLGAGDASEATTLGLSAGQFILYIKAEDPKYLEGKKYFTLSKTGYKTTRVTMKVVETKSA